MIGNAKVALENLGGSSLKKELDLQDKVLDVRIVLKALDKRECEEFEMAMQRKSKLHIYSELNSRLGLRST